MPSISLAMIVKPSTTRAGTFTVALPADKSLTHRSLIFAACAKGNSTIINPSPARDCKTTAAALRQLGVVLELESGKQDPGMPQVACAPARLEIVSHGQEHWRSPSVPLDCGNSGTTARLLLGLLAAQPGLSCTCRGDASLNDRPMGRVVRWLRQAGASIDGESGGERLPLTIRGRQLRPISCKLETASAQVKSALLLAAMNISGDVQIDLPDGTRLHTEEMLRQQGVDCTWHTHAGRQQLNVRGPYTLRPQVWHIAADPSAAAFFIVLGLLSPREVCIVLPGVLADDNRLSFLRVIRAMGGKVQRRERGVGVCELVVQGRAQLLATEVSAAEMPALIDEVPILTVLALFSAGRTVWHGAGELRTKESDRLTALANLCRAAGRGVEVQGDTLAVYGNDAPVAPYVFDAQGDHRLSMAAAICASFATQPCVLENAACVDISFPNFFSHLYAVTQGG